MERHHVAVIGAANDPIQLGRPCVQRSPFLGFPVVPLIDPGDAAARA